MVHTHVNHLEWSIDADSQISLLEIKIHQICGRPQPPQMNLQQVETRAQSGSHRCRPCSSRWWGALPAQDDRTGRRHWRRPEQTQKKRSLRYQLCLQRFYLILNRFALGSWTVLCGDFESAWPLYEGLRSLPINYHQLSNLGQITSSSGPQFPHL